MGKKIILFVILNLIFLINLASPLMEVGDDVPFEGVDIEIEIPTPPINYTINTNYSNFSKFCNIWDTFDVPTDIPNSEFWVNDTSIVFNLWNSTWDTPGVGDGSYNATYDAKADYQFTDNNFNGSGNFTTTGTGQFATLGINIAAPTNGLLKIDDHTATIVDTYYGIYNRHTKATGITNSGDSFLGLYNHARFSQSGGVLGSSKGIFNLFSLIDGDIGNASNARFIKVINNRADFNGGKIYGDVFGSHIEIDQEATNEVTGNIYGNYIEIDADGTVGGSVYGLYLDEGSNIDYGIYQDGSADNFLGGILNASQGITTPNITITDSLIGNGTDYFTLEELNATATGAGNLSWNQSLANTLYAPNITAGIQHLINDTGVYSTHNQTIYDEAKNKYNTTYDAKADYQFTNNNFNGSGDFTTTGTGQFATLGINVAAPASTSGLLRVTNDNINTTTPYFGFMNSHQKTAGVTDGGDDFSAFWSYLNLNQAGGVIGRVWQIYNDFTLTDGETLGIYGIYNLIDLRAGKVSGDAQSFFTSVDQSNTNEVTGNIYGHYISVDADGTVGGTVYGLYINDLSNVDYGIYQSGVADNFLGGALDINGSISGHNLYPQRATMFMDEATKITGSGTPTAFLRAGQQYYFGVYNTIAGDGDSFSLSFYLKAGTYDFYVLGVTSNTYAKTDWAVDGVNIVTGQDWYSVDDTLNVLKSASGITITGDGYHLITGTINGRNASANGWYYEFTKVWFKPTTDPARV